MLTHTNLVKHMVAVLWKLVHFVFSEHLLAYCTHIRPDDIGPCLTVFLKTVMQGHAEYTDKCYVNELGQSNKRKKDTKRKEEKEGRSRQSGGRRVGSR